MEKRCYAMRLSLGWMDMAIASRALERRCPITHRDPVDQARRVARRCCR
jgi:hypothetical protein